jgi:hypothetical protein
VRKMSAPAHCASRANAGWGVSLCARFRQASLMPARRAVCHEHAARVELSRLMRTTHRTQCESAQTRESHVTMRGAFAEQY